MSGWLLNIVGMVFISVLLEIVLPSGKTNSFIKMVFGIFVLYVIVSPLPKIFNKNINLLGTSASRVQTNFLITLNLDKISALEKNITEGLNEAGFKNVSVVVSANVYGEQFNVQKIYIDLINLVLNKSDKHININKEMYLVVLKYVDILEEDVVFYG